MGYGLQPSIFSDHVCARPRLQYLLSTRCSMSVWTVATDSQFVTPSSRPSCLMSTLTLDGHRPCFTDGRLTVSPLREAYRSHRDGSHRVHTILDASEVYMYLHWPACPNSTASPLDVLMLFLLTICCCNISSSDEPLLRGQDPLITFAPNWA